MTNYSGFEMEVVERLARIEQRLDTVEGHDQRIASLEASRNWVRGGVAALWILFGGAVAALWRKMIP